MLFFRAPETNMKKIIKILVIFFLFFSSNQANSEKHNQVSVELDRIKNDIIDLQKFVYKNESSLSKSANSSEKNNLEESSKIFGFSKELR